MIITKQTKSPLYEELNGIKKIYLFDPEKDRQTELKIIDISIFEDVLAVNYMTVDLFDSKSFDNYYNDEIYKNDSLFGYDGKTANKILNQINALIGDLNLSFYNLSFYGSSKNHFTLNLFELDFSKRLTIKRFNSVDRFKNPVNYLSVSLTSEVPERLYVQRFTGFSEENDQGKEFYKKYVNYKKKFFENTGFIYE